jgi:hypothetical protein
MTDREKRIRDTLKRLREINNGIFRGNPYYDLFGPYGNEIINGRNISSFFIDDLNLNDLQEPDHSATFTYQPFEEEPISCENKCASEYLFGVGLFIEENIKSNLEVWQKIKALRFVHELENATIID